jgi:hypothetical protein
MSLPVILSPSAKGEVEAAVNWYEEEAGLGAKFVTSVQEALDRIGQRSDLASPSDGRGNVLVTIAIERGDRSPNGCLRGDPGRERSQAR